MISLSSQDRVFVSVSDEDGVDHILDLVGHTLETLSKARRDIHAPLPPGGPEAVEGFARDVFADLEKTPSPEAFTRLIEAYGRWAVDVSHPATAARMQCPPTAYAVAADLAAACLNQSLHAWEAGPFALQAERYVVERLARLAGYGPESGGTLTAGGSLSNIMAMIAARDEAVQRRFGQSGSSRGIADLGVRPVVLCSRATHFSIERGANVSGMGADGILTLPADRQGRLIPDAVAEFIDRLPEHDLPVILIACTGSTDLGWVDPLPELAEICRERNIWLHADAAYGGGALFSKRLRDRMAGIELADSITLDMHKFGWAPASAGVFLVREAASLRHFSLNTTSLNVSDDAAAGYMGLYGDSLQATRRSDALKILANLVVIGEEGLGAMVERCCDLAREGAAWVEAEPRLRLAEPVEMSTVLFQYEPEDTAIDIDDFNARLRRRLMEDGSVLLARTWSTDAAGHRRDCLKLMLLNPSTTSDWLRAALRTVVDTGRRMEQAMERGGTGR